MFPQKQTNIRLMIASIYRWFRMTSLALLCAGYRLKKPLFEGVGLSSTNIDECYHRLRNPTSNNSCRVIYHNCNRDYRELGSITSRLWEFGLHSPQRESRQRKRLEMEP